MGGGFGESNTSLTERGYCLNTGTLDALDVAKKRADSMWRDDWRVS